MIDRDFEARAELLERERARSTSLSPRELLERMPCPACDLEPRTPDRRICIVCGRLVEGLELEAHEAARESGSAARGQREGDDTGPALVFGLDPRKPIGLVKARPPRGVIVPRPEGLSGRGRGEAREAGGASGGAASAEARAGDRAIPPRAHPHSQAICRDPSSPSQERDEKHNDSTPLIGHCSGRITRAHAPDLMATDKCRRRSAATTRVWLSWCWERWDRPSSSRCRG